MATGLLCVILGTGFLADPSYSVNPDAVATAGAAVAVRAETGAGALSIVIEGPRAGRLREIAAIAAGTGAADALLATACPENAERSLLVDRAGREVPDGVILWPPEQSDAGGGSAPEIARALREFIGIPVARPLPPWNRRVSVLRMPADVSEDTLLAAAFRSPWTSWVMAGKSVYLASEDPAQVAEMLEAEGAERVADEVELGQLRLVGAELPAGARALGGGQITQLALCPSGCTDGAAWLDRRFGRAE